MALGDRAPVNSLRKVAEGEMSTTAILRQAIRVGILLPGTPLIQESLSRILDVSRIPIRESLLTLAAEGLVVFRDGRGATVTELSPADVDELYSLRILLETAMAPKIAARVATHEIQSLKRLVARMDSVMTNEERRADWAESNFEFHKKLYAIARLPHFERFAIQVLNLTETYSRVFVFSLGGLEQSQEEHHEMVGALERGDAEALEAILIRHSGRAKDGLLEYVADQESKQQLHELSQVMKPVQALAELNPKI